MNADRQVFRIRPDNAPTKPLRGNRGVSYLLVNPQMGVSEHLDVHLNELAPGSGPGPTHFHQQAENLYWVLEGRLEVTVDDDVHVLERGDILFIPPGVIHATRNGGEVVSRFIEIYAPPGPDFHIVEPGEA